MMLHMIRGDFPLSSPPVMSNALSLDFGFGLCAHTHKMYAF